MLKPDAIPRLKLGLIIKKFEQKGLRLLDIQVATPTRPQIELHYEEHKGKSFYEPLCEYVLSGQVVKIKMGGLYAITEGRKIIKRIRSELCLGGRKNLIHGSDSEESAKRELNLWFGQDEVEEDVVEGQKNEGEIEGEEGQ
jgi:nucleoside-diphosphate kinase